MCIRVFARGRDCVCVAGGHVYRLRANLGLRSVVSLPQSEELIGSRERDPHLRCHTATITCAAAFCWLLQVALAVLGLTCCNGKHEVYSKSRPKTSGNQQALMRRETAFEPWMVICFQEPRSTAFVPIAGAYS